jgi:hypothetical protein
MHARRDGDRFVPKTGSPGLGDEKCPDPGLSEGCRRMTKKGRKMQKRHNFERQSENEDDDQDLQLVEKAGDWSFQQHRSPLKELG